MNVINVGNVGNGMWGMCRVPFYSMALFNYSK
jgi:hypothetical protein